MILAWASPFKHNTRKGVPELQGPAYSLFECFRQNNWPNIL